MARSTDPVAAMAHASRRHEHIDEAIERLRLHQRTVVSGRTPRTMANAVTTGLQTATTGRHRHAAVARRSRCPVRDRTCQVRRTPGISCEAPSLAPASSASSPCSTPPSFHEISSCPNGRRHRSLQGLHAALQCDRRGGGPAWQRAAGAPGWPPICSSHEFGSTAWKAQARLELVAWSKGTPH